jgi:hypothetical protein
MLKKLLLAAGITLALTSILSAEIPWPPCEPCLVNIAQSR